MKRRKFIQSATTAGAFLPMIGSVTFLYKSSNEEELISLFLAENDKRVRNILDLQQKDKAHPFYGGFPDKYEIYHPSRPAAYAQSLISAFVSEASEFYRSREIKDCLKVGMEFLVERQHEDGTIDLLTTNFHSPPDTAFAVEPLSLALLILKKYSPEYLQDFQQIAKSFLLEAGKAMSVGGIHTPNHRWVVCRALARIHSLFPNQEYLDRIEAWLAEGIDIDPDGQYTEKSSVVYSPLTNNCFISLARILKKTELYEVVRKNLQMSQYMMHANGEVVTEASTRQDKFTVAHMGRYYYAYRYMALKDQDASFSAMAHSIEETVGFKSLSGNLPYFLEDEELEKPMPKTATLDLSYEKSFPHSHMVRIRRGKMDATILGRNSSFFTFFHGSAALQAIRFATAFFGKGQFSSPELSKEGESYMLSQELWGPYYQPHEKENIAADGDWHKMPRSKRKQSEVQYLKSVVRISEQEGKCKLHFSIQGTEHIPLAIELAFRAGGKLKGVEAVAEVEHAFFLKDGYGSFQSGEESIRFGPAMHKHKWTQLRGAKAKLNGDSVYLTAYTPLEFELEIEGS
ncbi:MAG: hypothetical protein R8P61_33925 [Bacteroidia bacterium]|nr:hypothetical protein [Bacteroidia bacterium]